MQQYELRHLIVLHRLPNGFHSGSADFRVQIETVGWVGLESAAQLREDLRTTQCLFDPKGAATASHHVVVIAHSMGGLLAHTLASDSGENLWNVFATKPLNSLSLSAEEKNALLEYFFFRHQPAIDRLIFLAVPHRGSRLADGIVGSVVNRLIRHSKSPAQAMKELATEYPGILDPYFAKGNARGGPTTAGKDLEATRS